MKTPGGVGFDKIALVHGTECLASTVYQDCIHWKTSAGCSFCGIGLSLAGNSTVLEKDPEDLGLVAEHALRLDAVTHVTLTTGLRVSEKAVVRHLSACTRAIKQHSSLPVHVQLCPPGDLTELDELRHAGADTIGMHIESFDGVVLRRIAPVKAACGRESYMRAWKHAVAVFGKNQVSSFLIAGLGEEPASILAGAELLCELGVFPYLLPFRPIPGTPLAETLPPDPERMVFLYEQVAAMLRNCGLSSASCTAGCVRCGACSSITLFE
jgi:radical SAM protein (TIGR04043 family)